MKSYAQENNGTVFIVDDEYSMRDSLSLLVRSRKLICDTFDSGESFLSALPSYSPLMIATIVLDVRMKEMSGVKIFQSLRDREILWPVIFLTGHGHVAMAVDVMRSGAFDFIEKPFNNNRLVDVILEALNECRHRVERHHRYVWLKEKLNTMQPDESDAFESLLKTAGDKDVSSLTPVEQKVLEILEISSVSALYELLDESGWRYD